MIPSTTGEAQTRYEAEISRSIPDPQRNQAPSQTAQKGKRINQNIERERVTKQSSIEIKLRTAVDAGTHDFNRGRGGCLHNLGELDAHGTDHVGNHRHVIVRPLDQGGTRV